MTFGGVQSCSLNFCPLLLILCPACWLCWHREIAFVSSKCVAAIYLVYYEHSSPCPSISLAHSSLHSISHQPSETFGRCMSAAAIVQGATTEVRFTCVLCFESLTTCVFVSARLSVAAEINIFDRKFSAVNRVLIG